MSRVDINSGDGKNKCIFTENKERERVCERVREFEGKREGNYNSF